MGPKSDFDISPFAFHGRAPRGIGLAKKTEFGSSGGGFSWMDEIGATAMAEPLLALESRAISSPSVEPQRLATDEGLWLDGLAANRRFGPYEILGEVAKGGMGVVYRARHSVSGETVALKMIRADKAVASDEIGRFRVEAQTAGALRHPNIVPICEIGEHAGRQYFTMPLAVGGSLARRIRELGTAPRRAVVMMEKVARAVEYAHRHGIVHRDLKPSNVLLDERDEPQVCDFGLAKYAGNSGAVSQSAPVGTPQYMAPEQVKWPAERVGPQTDVWALGVVLYELLTGQRPFSGEAYSELTYHILLTEPRPPHEVRPELPKELSGIVLNCLQKRPALRYQTAAAFADALASWLRGNTVPVAPLGVRPLRGLARTHPIIAALVALAVIGVPAAVPVLMLRADDAGPLKRAELTLADGHPLLLIGSDGGAPDWAEWALGKGKGTAAIAEDKTCVLQCWQFGLFEVLPDVRTPRYRLSAEIRHIAGDRVGIAGLYLAHARNITDDGVFHSFLTLSFNDRFALTAGAPNGPARGSANLAFRVVKETEGPNGFTCCINSGVNKAFAILDPDEHRGEGWRRVAVEVTEDSVRAYWDGGLIGEWSRQEMKVRLDAEVANLPRGGMPNPVSGGLGICIHKGAATIRNLRIEPL